jgi:hypothetical protein
MSLFRTSVDFSEFRDQIVPFEPILDELSPAPPKCQRPHRLTSIGGSALATKKLPHWCKLPLHRRRHRTSSIKYFSDVHINAQGRDTSRSNSSAKTTTTVLSSQDLERPSGPSTPQGGATCLKGALLGLTFGRRSNY